MLDENFRFIFRSLRRLGVQPADLDDATQQVFIVASNNLARIELGRERAYLFGTAMRIAANTRRSQLKRTALQTESRHDQDSHRPCPTPDELLEHKQNRELLDGILNALPTELRTVFVLFELEGMSSPEIAVLVDLPLGTVASRLRRARERFADEVERIRQKMRAGGPR